MFLHMSRWCFIRNSVPVPALLPIIWLAMVTPAGAQALPEGVGQYAPLTPLERQKAAEAATGAGSVTSNIIDPQAVGLAPGAKVPPIAGAGQAPSFATPEEALKLLYGIRRRGGRITTGVSTVYKHPDKQPGDKLALVRRYSYADGHTYESLVNLRDRRPAGLLEARLTLTCHIVGKVSPWPCSPASRSGPVTCFTVHPSTHRRLRIGMVRRNECCPS